MFNLTEVIQLQPTVSFNNIAEFKCQTVQRASNKPISYLYYIIKSIFALLQTPVSSIYNFKWTVSKTETFLINTLLQWE
jgi:hypothetical protein